MRFEPSREASKLMKKRLPEKMYKKTRIFYEHVPKSVKMGCPFRRENLLCASLFATRAPKVAQRGPKGGPGRPRVLKVTKIHPKLCPKASQTSKQQQKHSKEHSPYRIILRWNKTRSSPLFWVGTGSKRAGRVLAH